ncbi:MAG: DUF1080 domain-containing protein [Verrucomicrobiales bacterium]|nr:DUF1080 domain-containing protein [Verrucomicrobiales bacterium]
MNRCLIVLCTVCFTGMVSGQNKAKKPDPNIVQGSRTLERVEAVAQWVSLFDGKDLAHWQGDTEKYIPQDGILVCEKGGKILETKKAYSDFAFHFEFKLEESGNSGIGIRVPKGGHAAYGGMEIQILDHNGSKYKSETVDGKKVSWLKPWQVHGSIYGVMPAKTGYLKPVGEWNSETIICIEDHIMVIVNGAVIVDTYLEEISPVDGRPHPGLRNPSGHITLAGHNDRVEFRNLKVTDFSPSPPTPQSDADNTPPAGFASLFNGKDLTGWKGLAHRNANDRRALKGDALKEAQAVADENMKEHWSVVDGILTYDGEGMSLCTDKDYGDFEMYMDWKIPPGADSGVYLRGTPQVQIWDPWDPRMKEKDMPETPEEIVTAYRNGRNLGSGGLWNNRRYSNRPLVLADNKPGEWNTFLIRMVGEKVSIWLNKKLIVDRTVLENYWDKNGRLIPIPREDQIELQHHGSELFFKNLYIRELPY